MATPPDASPTVPAGCAGSRRVLILAAAALGLAALAAYHNSFLCPYVFDDHGTIVENTTIRSLGAAFRPPEEGMPVTGRPVANLTFAINYALGGLDVRGFHAANLLIHFLGSLALFGIVRRTLRQGVFIAFAAALIWLLHPLQTESVTFISQRVESLMGLFYLATVYCFIRYAGGTEAGEDKTQEGEQAGRGLWALLSVGACLFGMGTKEVMATAPVLVLLYDRTFVAGTFREALRRRGLYYGALACTWVVLAVLLAGTGSRGGTAGFAAAIPWPVYALTQFRAIAHYLRLSVWPRPLVFFYGSTVGAPTGQLVADILVVSGLAGLSIYGLAVRSRLAFAGAAFFLILAPSSSVVPVATETIAEHRMYLPLAAVVVAGLLALKRAIGAILGRSSAAAGRAFLVVGLAVAAWLGIWTEARNRDYAREMTLWRATVDRFPGNEIAQYNLALMCGREGRIDEAIAHYREALRIKPDYPEARNNLGRTLADKGLWVEAVAQYREAIAEDSGFARIHSNLGNALFHLGRVDEAIASYQHSLQLDPDSPETCYDLGTALVRAGRDPEAADAYGNALRLRPRYPQAHNDLATTLARMGRLGDAVTHYAEAARLDPGSAVIQSNLGYALLADGRPAEAVGHYREALRLEPDNTDAHNNLGYALAQLGRFAEARAEFEAVLRLKPGDADARANLARLPRGEGP